MGDREERVGKKGAISDDCFVLNCAVLTRLRTLMEPGFQGERFGDAWKRTLEITQSRDRQSFKRSGHSFERKVRKPGEGPGRNEGVAWDIEGNVWKAPDHKNTKQELRD